MVFTATDNPANIEHRLSDVQLFLIKCLLMTLIPLDYFYAEDILHSEKEHCYRALMFLTLHSLSQIYNSLKCSVK